MKNSDQPNPEETIVFDRYGRIKRATPKKQDLEAQGIEVEREITLEELFEEDKKRKLKAQEIGAQRIEDKQEHKVTKTGDKTHETTIWKFKDPTKAKLETFMGWHGIEWALMELARKTNQAIEKEEIPGIRLGLGDIIQACIVNYYIPSEKKVYSPETTKDSPFFGTLPYKLIKAEDGGYPTTELAMPQEMAMHMNIPTTVGELIITLSKEKQKEVIVTLQLKEATHGIENEEELNNYLKQSPKTEYKFSESVNSQAADYFEDFLKSQDQPIETEETPAMTLKPIFVPLETEETQVMQRSNDTYLPEAIETRQMSRQEQEELLRARKKLSERLRNTDLDFKF